MAKYADTECYEEHATYTVDVPRDDGPQARVVLRTPWAKRYDLMEELLSDNAYPFPDIPSGWTNIWPIKVGCVPDETKYTTDSDGQTIIYEDAIITVEYGYIYVSTNPAGAKTRIAEQLEPTTEFLNIVTEPLAWVEEGQLDPSVGPTIHNAHPVDLENEAMKLVRIYNLVRQIYKQETIPGDILTLSGKVNRDTYVSQILGLTFQPETLLFNPPSLDRSITVVGSKGWNVTIKFTYKPWGWNRAWDRELEAWKQMYHWKLPDRFYNDPDNPAAGWAIEPTIDDWEYKNHPLGDFQHWLF